MRALVIADEGIGASMAGNAIRSVEIARALRSEMEVTLAAPSGGDVDYVLHHPVTLGPLLYGHDVVIGQPAWPLLAGWLRRSPTRVIYDLYDPEPLEALEFLRAQRPSVRRLVTALSRDRLRNALHDGHALVCASRAQRELYTGALLAEGLLAPAVYDADPALERVLATVPFGVADRPPEPGPGARERFGFAAEDEVVLWNGGLWAWLDPATAIRAVTELARTRPRVRLVFMGASTAAQSRAADARRLAGELGVLDEHVYFNDAWVPYAQRGGWMLDANCAVSTHVDHLETRFAYRTRLLDCFWSGLPVVCTGGDELGELVAAEGLGATVAARDVDALVAALTTVLDRGRGAYAPALARTADRLRWSEVTRPLVTLAAGGVHAESLGARAGRRRPAGAAGRFRDTGYRTAKRTLAAVGRPEWPRLG